MSFQMSFQQLAEIPPQISALGGTVSTVCLAGFALLARWARTHRCTPGQLADSLGRRLAAAPRSVLSLAFRRLRGRHRMWDLHAVQELIRADHRTLTRRS